MRLAGSPHPGFQGFVFLGEPSNGLLKAGMSIAAQGLAAHSGFFGFGIVPFGVEGCYVEVNRNMIVEQALAFHEVHGLPQPVTAILWLDWDVTGPSNGLLRLLAHEKPIVGCNYRGRDEKYKMTGQYLDGEAMAAEGGLHRMVNLPGGYLLVRREVYEKLAYPWYAPPTPGEPDRDDIKFCRHAREAGFDIWCDNDLTREITHDAVQRVGWFRPEQLVRVKGAHHRVIDGAEMESGEELPPGLAADQLEYEIPAAPGGASRVPGNGVSAPHMR